MNETDLFRESAELVRSRDRDRYLTARFAPAAVRADLVTLYAFNCELDRIPRLVSEPALGDIRLQWWRDVLEGGPDCGPTGNPLADALIATVASHGLPRPALQGMIDARHADLDGGGFADWQALRAYLYKSDGAVFALSAHILGGTGKAVLEACNRAAIAYGIASRLQQLPHDCAAARIMLPLSVLDDAGVSAHSLLAGETGEGMTQAVAEVVLRGCEALEEARDQVSALPRAVRPAFAPLAVVEPLFAEMEKTGFRLLRDVPEINPLRQFWRIWRASRS